MRRVCWSAQRRGWVSGLTLSSLTSLPSIFRAQAHRLIQKRAMTLASFTAMDGERSYGSYSKLYLYITAYDIPRPINAGLTVSVGKGKAKRGSPRLHQPSHTQRRGQRRARRAHRGPPSQTEKPINPHQDRGDTPRTPREAGEGNRARGDRVGDCTGAVWQEPEQRRGATRSRRSVYQ